MTQGKDEKENGRKTRRDQLTCIPHIMMHHFLLSELDCSRTGVMGSAVGEVGGWRNPSADPPSFTLANSPWATSREVRSSGIVDEVENQPPGKSREEVVDSRRFRVEVGEVSGERATVVCVASLPSERCTV
jgi:hypothetical protein